MIGDGHDLDFFKRMGVNRDDYEEIVFDKNIIGKKLRTKDANNVKYYEYYKNDLVLMPRKKYFEYLELMKGEYRGPSKNNFVVRGSFKEGAYIMGYLPVEYLLYKLYEMGYVIYHPRRWKYPSNIYTHVIDFVETLKNFDMHDYVIQRIKNIKKEYGRITFGNFNKRIKKNSS